jgi:ketosteroid isomerase-like protein
MKVKLSCAEFCKSFTSLQKVVQQFLDAVDHGEVAKVHDMYDPDFQNVRVADDGGFVQLTAAQILGMLQNSPVGTFPTKQTTIHHAEVIGDMGFVLMTRVKDLGKGFEPMFYSLVWRRRDGRWQLLREFVHQKTSPARD